MHGHPDEGPRARPCVDLKHKAQQIGCERAALERPCHNQGQIVDFGDPNTACDSPVAGVPLYESTGKDKNASTFEKVHFSWHR